jgi:RNA polymerase sigma factor (sigma-70 family)
MGDEPVTDAARESRVDDCLGGLLERWQASGDPAQLEAVVVAVRQVVELVAGRTLAECHVADRSAIDDVVSLVLDHLRRLPRGSAGERRVALFRSDDATVGRGLAYIRLLARNRARDVARARHRRDRHAQVFSMLDDTGWQAVSAGRPVNDLHERLLDAVAQLEPPLRQVVELLLEGKSQATIAHVLDICDGTVSRMRKRAVDRLRELLDT